MNRTLHRTITALSLFLLALTPAFGQDEEEKKLGWFNNTELSVLQTSGNTEAGSFAFRNDLARVWENAVFTLEAGGLQAESTVFTRFATAPSDGVNFTLVENERTDTTAETYFLRGRYDHQITDALFWYAGAGWEQNKFAGFDSRIQVVGGVGNIWFEDDSSHFRTYYGVTWTSQDDIVKNPLVEEEFVGLQLGWDYGRQLTSNTIYENLLKIDANLDEGDDWRADMVNSLTTSMSDRLALKLSLQLLYDNLPSLVGLDFIDANGDRTGDTFFTELDDLDSIFTAALVISF